VPNRGGRLTVRVRTCIALVTGLLLATLAVAPVGADTTAELDAARAHLTVVQRDLDTLTRQYAAAQSRLAETVDRMDAVQQRLDGVRAHMRSIQRDLSARARGIYMSGGAGTLELLLASDSFDQFSDRIEYLGRVAQGDGDLMSGAAVTGEQLRREEAELASLSKQQQSTAATLKSEEAAIADKLAEAQALEAKLTDQLALERAAAAAAAAHAAAVAAAARTAPAHPTGTGALKVCPVGNPHSFTDSFGDPRPGGRTHQGIDMIAPYGTPIYAAQSGRYEDDYNTLGGMSAEVWASNGDYTYYAHMSSRAGIGNGATVSAGTVIGYVGHTGDTVVNHLHFEYHPGGGSAIDPYTMLVALC